MPRRALTVAALAGTAVSVLVFGGAGAAGKPTRDRFCAPTGNFCTAIVGTRAAPRFELSTVVFTGVYRLCVVDADGVRTCNVYGLHRVRHRLFRSRVAWIPAFPATPGRHRVAWIKDGVRLGPLLSFGAP